jgi:hypothetical protein
VFSWDHFYQYRKMVRKQFPDFWRLRVIKKPLEILREELRPQQSILDVGAGNREIGEKIKKSLAIEDYKSMDVDRSQGHDYYSFAEIEACFDGVLLFEVIEHLDFKDGIDLIKALYARVSLGGKLFVTTPNLYHPNRYWEDCQHKTPYCYDELGGLLSASGFEIKACYRVYNDAFIRRVFRMHIGVYLHRYLNIDFAPSILLVAQKEG